METIKDTIISLQSNLKESAKIIASEFQSKCQNIADKLSDRINELESYANENKEHSIEIMREQYDSLKSLMLEYQHATEDKIEDYRIKIVNKLNELNKKIEQYNSNKKH